MDNQDRFCEWYIQQINPRTGRKYKEGSARTYIAAINRLVRAADFRFDPAKLEIAFFRIPIEEGESPVAIARHSDVRYDGRGPALDRGDFEDVDGDEVYRCHTSFTLADLKTFPQHLK